MPITNTGERLKKLRTERGYSQEDVAKLIGVGRTTYLKYENGDNKPTRKLKELSALFSVSTDYLLGNDAPAASSLPPLTPKDEREISKDLENMIESLSGAAAMGDSEDDEDMEMLKASLKQAMVLSKRIAKKKFTPKKYQKD